MRLYMQRNSFQPDRGFQIPVSLEITARNIVKAALIYRVTISDDSRGYNYEWNPCEYQTCNDEIEPGKDCAVS